MDAMPAASIVAVIPARGSFMAFDFLTFREHLGRINVKMSSRHQLRKNLGVAATFRELRISLVYRTYVR